MWRTALTHVHADHSGYFWIRQASPHALKELWLILSKAEVRSFRKMKERKNGPDTESSQKAPLSLLYFYGLLAFVFTRQSSILIELSAAIASDHFHTHAQLSQTRIPHSCRWLVVLFTDEGLALFSVGLAGRTHRWSLEVKRSARDVANYCIRCSPEASGDHKLSVCVCVCI